jgi:predicted anti-sigma-YlaC factor YlaD
MKKGLHFSIFLVLISSFFLGSCRSVEKVAVSRLSDMLSSDAGAGAFTRDNDPQLVADALPFALKMYELLMEMNPEDSALRLAAGKAFIMYANGFIQTPASMLSDDDYEEQQAMLERAGLMYIRGRNYVLESLYMEIKDGETLVEQDLNEFLEKSGKKQVPHLYWAAAGDFGAFSCDPFDMEQGQELYKSFAFLYRALEVDEEYADGSIHDLLMTLWASLPRSIIDNAFLETAESAGLFASGYYEKFQISQDAEARSRFHFDKAIALSEGKNPGTYISMALSYPVMKQNYDEFESLLLKALEQDPYENPDTQLMVLIYQKRAAWLLDHREDYFLMDF